MDAVFKIKVSEFNESLFASIKSLIKGQDGEITITLHEAGNNYPLRESAEEYIARIKKASADLESGKGIAFTMEELGDFIKQ